MSQRENTPVNMPKDPRLERIGLVALVIAMPLAMSVGALGAGRGGPAAAAPFLIAAAVLFAIVFVRRLTSLVVLGLAGGAVAGLLAGGVGGRLAMRIVALMGGRVEMTLGGTAFLLMFATVPGAVFGVVLSALRRLRRLPAWGVGLATMAVPGLPMLVGDPDARGELLHEGQAWFNFPAFFALMFVYGFVAQRIMDRLDGRLPRQGAAA